MITRCNNCNDLYEVSETGRMAPRHLSGFCPACQGAVIQALDSRPKRYVRYYLPPLGKDKETALVALKAFKQRPDFLKSPQGYLGEQTDDDLVIETFYSEDVEYSLMMVKSTNQELVRVAYELDTQTNEISGYWMSGERHSFSKESVKQSNQQETDFFRDNQILVLREYPRKMVPCKKKNTVVEWLLNSFYDLFGRTKR